MEPFIISVLKVLAGIFALFFICFISHMYSKFMWRIEDKKKLELKESPKV